MDYVQRSRRSQAMGGVLEMANLQQQFYADNFRFGATISNAVIDYVDDSDHYDFSIVSGGTTSFTVRATAVGTQLQDTDCRRFQLTNTGLKTATNSASGDSTATCWRD
ncbi:MAG: type IV pilin protein [Gammaproteobacteria bacterium]|nr:type IV pilin protein [Gammaproteobacteria bacterium]